MRKTSKIVTMRELTLSTNVSKVRNALKVRKTLDRLGNKRIPEKSWSNYAKNQKANALASKAVARNIPSALIISQGMKASNDQPAECP